MEARKSINEVDRVYLDTSIYIYLFENNPRFAADSEQIFLDLVQQQTTIIASTLLITELLVAPIKEKQLELARIYKYLDDHIPGLEFIPLTREISILSAELRAKYNLKTPDAIHLATALATNTQLFITADKKIKNIKEIKVQYI
ncbi:VapC toxin family PIN domain ribonuclease [Candidatus Roizmanbacteria bacterium CG22_combo_CG10-13_8_21_14_all_38_20]|uniref:VapC toxin family PIN domain ribonuclease n=1 Tax=Candidatus Roizmanbacteria bacterium CG22_combo_CG10-13_8_21_14_all_38_20 TaxID=1974862 RepID=A0A2H0BUI1_9BACT|nr:type II toxin-antitoxin system VapC family toxin [Candidatus Microgenomates bacterium]PIP61264.1 MAG: VapC toxin family PIN domain ribonuclease [Candidatus Roizmanbacteria bacterium CG22_combo_CG10-13_8_21_14_all_38_20]PJC31740.1 MAG: VapC toxin family PIN domain ribonuclease [Candidatus Roizmanbacteria bacterium CG_4_9_14_0_2_um_filter_38_17]